MRRCKRSSTRSQPATCSLLQGALDFINSYSTEIAAKAQRVNGMPPVKVDAVEIIAANGTIPGGYFPLKYRRPSQRLRDHGADLEAAHVAKHAAATDATTKHGHEKARAATVNIPVRLDFGVMFETCRP